MIVTKEYINRSWAICWSTPSDSDIVLLWKILTLAFKNCKVHSEVGFGNKPTADQLSTGQFGYVQWVSWSAWASVPKNQEEHYRHALFSSLPPNAEVNAVLFRREEEADCFKEIIDQRIAWLALGGEKYWITS